MKQSLLKEIDVKPRSPEQKRHPLPVCRCFICVTSLPVEPLAKLEACHLVCEFETHRRPEKRFATAPFTNCPVLSLPFMPMIQLREHEARTNPTAPHLHLHDEALLYPQEVPSQNQVPPFGCLWKGAPMDNEKHGENECPYMFFPCKPSLGLTHTGPMVANQTQPQCLPLISPLRAH